MIAHGRQPGVEKLVLLLVHGDAQRGHCGHDPALGFQVAILESRAGISYDQGTQVV